MLKTFWVENQRFLLLCGGTFLAFLVASSVVGRLNEGAEETYQRCRLLQQQIDKLHKDLKQTYHWELERARAYAEQEVALEEELGMPPEPKLGDSKALLIQLNREIERTWGAVQTEASRRGLALPQKLAAADFGAQPRTQSDVYAVYHSYLWVVRRALECLVHGGVTSIGRPQLIQEMLSEVTLADGGLGGDPRPIGRCRFRGVGFTVRGPYESFVRTLALAQEPKEYLQVRIAGELSPSRSGTEDELQGHLEFYAFRVERPAQALAFESPPDEEPLVSPRR